MLKQALKTINTEFIQTCALSQLSFVYFRPYATSFPGLLLSLMVMSKRKKDPGDKSGPYVFIQDLLLNVCCVLFNWCHNFIQKKYDRKRCLPHTCISSFRLQFFFLYWILTTLTTPKGKKKINRLCQNSLNSFYYFFMFWFKGLHIKTQFKTEFWPSVNGGQLVPE